MFFKAKLACSFYRSMLVILTCLSISSQPLENKGEKSSLRNCNSTMMNVLGNFTNGNCSGSQTSPTTNMPNGTKKESQSVSILPYDFYYYTLYYSEFGNREWQGQKTKLKGIQLSEKYKETFDVSSEGPSTSFLIIDTINLHGPFSIFFYRLNHDNRHMHHGIIIYWNGFLRRIFNWYYQYLGLAYMLFQNTSQSVSIYKHSIFIIQPHTVAKRNLNIGYTQS
jgi:hypothetical protein